jgi:hypothetical protein
MRRGFPPPGLGPTRPTLLISVKSFRPLSGNPGISARIIDLAANKFRVEGEARCARTFCSTAIPPRASSIYTVAIYRFSTAWPSRRVEKVTTEIKTTYICANFRTSSDELSDSDA